jgi:hypothetical protein
MRLWLFAALLLLLPVRLEAAEPVPADRDAACDVRELRFFNGFGLTLPKGVCVARTSGPDFRIYQFSSGEGAPAFLQAYVGNAADFPYSAPPNGMQRTASSMGEKLPCGTLLIRETPHGDVTQVGGRAALDGKRCGEILVRAPSVDGIVSSAAVHFWYSGLPTEQEQLARQIIDSAHRTEQLADDPPLKSGGR